MRRSNSFIDLAKVSIDSDLTHRPQHTHTQLSRVSRRKLELIKLNASRARYSFL